MMTYQQPDTCARGHSPCVCSHHVGHVHEGLAHPAEISMKALASYFPSHQDTLPIRPGKGTEFRYHIQPKKSHSGQKPFVPSPIAPGRKISGAHTLASYYITDAPPAPARAATMTRTTSRTTPHQFTFFIVMLNHNLFRYQQAELQPHTPSAPWLAQGHTLWACLHRGFLGQLHTPSSYTQSLYTWLLHSHWMEPMMI